ncbi:hypothetical protein LY76DRAFT_336547 [Colletotrichum caudatum]|nr:hypothetical protein LY76DRAFT_336547 [Colletotrichum caudatum]
MTLHGNTRMRRAPAQTEKGDDSELSRALTCRCLLGGPPPRNRHSRCRPINDIDRVSIHARKTSFQPWRRRGRAQKAPLSMQQQKHKNARPTDADGGSPSHQPKRVAANYITYTKADRQPALCLHSISLPDTGNDPRVPKVSLYETRPTLVRWVTVVRATPLRKVEASVDLFKPARHGSSSPARTAGGGGQETNAMSFLLVSSALRSILQRYTSRRSRPTPHVLFVYQLASLRSHPRMAPSKRHPPRADPWNIPKKRSVAPRITSPTTQLGMASQKLRVSRSRSPRDAQGDDGVGFPASCAH